MVFTLSVIPPVGISRRAYLDCRILGNSVEYENDNAVIVHGISVLYSRTGLLQCRGRASEVG